MESNEWNAFMKAVDEAIARSKSIMDDPRVMESIRIPEIVNLDVLKREIDLLGLFDVEDVTENIALNGKEIYHG